MSFSDHPHIKINPKNNYIMWHSSPGYIFPVGFFLYSIKTGCRQYPLFQIQVEGLGNLAGSMIAG